MGSALVFPVTRRHRVHAASSVTGNPLTGWASTRVHAMHAKVRRRTAADSPGRDDLRSPRNTNHEETPVTDTVATCPRCGWTSEPTADPAPALAYHQANDCPQR